MKKSNYSLIILAIFILSSCGEKSTKKRNLDDTLFKYAAAIRWADYDVAFRFVKPNDKTKKNNDLEIRRLKQFKVGSYAESPITPGNSDNVINQNVKIELYNIHTNKIKTIFDHQTWEFDSQAMQWYLTSGLPKL